MRKTINNNPDCEICADKSCATLTLDPIGLKQLSDGCSEILIKKGEPILLSGTKATHIVYLKAGIVKEYYQQSDEQEHILQVIKGPTYLGLQSLSGEDTNNLSYNALSDSIVCFIERKVFNSLLLNNGEFSFKIIQIICKDSLNHYYNFVSQNKKHIHGKLADTLLYLSEEIFQSSYFTLPLNRTEISYLIGASRESISKQLKTYEREGIIEISGRNIVIKEAGKLREISRFG